MKPVEKNILVIGASSAMAQETMKNFAADGSSFVLVARSEDKLQAIATDLTARGAKKVQCYNANADDLILRDDIESKAIDYLGHIDIALIAHGSLGNQQEDQESVKKTTEILSTNFISTVCSLTRLANYFEKRKSGSIAVISSVAGDRGRPSNYIYGSAKAGLSSFLSGLRARLFKAGVSVTTIKPGFVSTPMTAEFDQGPLFATSKKVGRGIYKAINKKKDISYQPGFWCLIMFVIKCIPECIFKRLNL